MQKWHYKLVIAEKHGKGIFGFVMPKEISWKVHYVNGKVLKNWTDIPLFNFIEDMGKEGWDIVQMNTEVTIRTGSLPIEHMYLLMKKPITN